MPKQAVVNIDPEDKRFFAQYCKDRKIYQNKLLSVFVEMLKGNNTYGKLELDWKVIGEHFPKKEAEKHIRDILLSLADREESIDFWDLYDHVQQTLGLEYSQAQINFVVEKCFCGGEVEVSDSGLIEGGRGKKRKVKLGMGSRWRNEWKDFCGTETAREMREMREMGERLGS